MIAGDGGGKTGTGKFGGDVLSGDDGGFSGLDGATTGFRVTGPGVVLG